MATYAIGDIQGCFEPLKRLLTAIQFNEKNDTLWFVGDLVNRGPQSLETLRFVKSLGDKHKTVLGNHDLHLLAVAYGVIEPGKEDTLNDILTAPDRTELIDWLRHCPLMVRDEKLGYIMTHAGLAPQWSVDEAMQLANEVETVLRSENPQAFFEHMYGNLPDNWDNQLTGMARLRCIVNYFTRMRFCYPDGRLDLAYKGEIAGKPHDLIPWFHVVPTHHSAANIIFGHWAALNGKTDVPHVFALDTGCVWGNSLTAMRLEDQHRFQVPC